MLCRGSRGSRGSCRGSRGRVGVVGGRVEVVGDCVEVVGGCVEVNLLLAMYGVYIGVTLHRKRLHLKKLYVII